MNKLNENQRKFLEYIQMNHCSLGYGVNLAKILKSNRYDYSKVSLILLGFDYLRKRNPDGSWCYPAWIKMYKKPIKYLSYDKLYENKYF